MRFEVLSTFTSNLAVEQATRLTQYVHAHLHTRTLHAMHAPVYRVLVKTMTTWLRIFYLV